VVLALLWLVATVAWIVALVDAGRFPPSTYEAAGRSKGFTMTMLLIAGVFGAIYYVLRIRNQIAR
jgi:hypothetical protein